MKIYFVESFAIVLVLTTVFATGELRRGRRCTQNKRKSPEGRFLEGLERGRDEFYTPDIIPYGRYTDAPRARYIPFRRMRDLLPFLRGRRCTQNKRKSPECRFLKDLEGDRDEFYTPDMIPYSIYSDAPIFRHFPFRRIRDLFLCLRSRRSTQNKKKYPKGKFSQNLERDRDTPSLNPCRRYTDAPEARNIVFEKMTGGRKCTQNKRKSSEGRFLEDLEGDRDEFYTPDKIPFGRYVDAPRFRFFPFQELRELRSFLRSRRSTQNKKKYPKGKFSQNLERDRDTPSLNPCRRYTDAPEARNILFGKMRGGRKCTQNKRKSPEGRFLEDLEGDRDEFYTPDKIPFSRYVDAPRFRFFPFQTIGELLSFLKRKVSTGQRKKCPKGRFLQYPEGGRNRIDPPGINPDARFLHNPNENIPGSPSDILTPLPDRRFLQGPIGDRNRVDPPGIRPGARFLNNRNENVPGHPNNILTPLLDRKFLHGPIGDRNRFDPAGINPDA